VYCIVPRSARLNHGRWNIKGGKYNLSNWLCQVSAASAWTLLILRVGWVYKPRRAAPQFTNISVRIKSPVGSLIWFQGVICWNGPSRHIRRPSHWKWATDLWVKRPETKEERKHSLRFESAARWVRDMSCSGRTPLCRPPTGQSRAEPNRSGASGLAGPGRAGSGRVGSDRAPLLS